MCVRSCRWWPNQIVRYGFSRRANIRAENLRAEGGPCGSTCVRVNGDAPRSISSTCRPAQCAQRPGRDRGGHRGGRPDAAIAKALNDNGVGRRFQRYGEVRCCRRRGSFTGR